MLDPDPAAAVKNENDRVKNMIDLHKVISEECRHTADIVWRFSMAILTFQGTAVGAALVHPNFGTAVILGVVGLITRNLSAMLMRQAVIRRTYLTRLQAAEEQLRPIYGKCFERIPDAPIHDFKSPRLPAMLIDLSHLMILLSVAWLTAELVWRSTPNGLIIK